jgi:hypothetical protein
MPRISSHFRALGFDKTTRTAPTSDPPSPRAWKRLKADIKLGVAQIAGVDLRNVRREESREKRIEWSGLRGLAGAKLTGNYGGSYGAKAVLDQLLEFRSSGQPTKNALTDLSDLELVQVYKNIKRNSSILSAIEQLHGDPSRLLDFANGVIGELTNDMRRRGMRAETIEPKDFDIKHDHNADIAHLLKQILPKEEAALLSAMALPLRDPSAVTQLDVKPQPTAFLELVAEHRDVFASKEFWSKRIARGNAEVFGLALSIAHLRELAVGVQDGRKITEEDRESLSSYLQTGTGKPDSEFAGRMKGVDLSNKPSDALFEMASIVANYFLEMREQDDGLGITAVFAFVNLLGAARAETDKRLLTAHDSGDPAQVITTLDYGIHAYMTTNGFYEAHIIEPLREIIRPPEATPEQPLIFHP